MQKYANSVQDTLGNAISVATVTVYTDSAHTALATIYSDNGITPTTNPRTTDSLGEFSFYAADGRYYIKVSKSGITTQFLDDVILFDPTASNSAASINTVQSGTGASTTDTQTELRFWVKLEHFGGVADGVTDNITAFNRIKTKFGGASKGGTIELGIGTYYFSTPPIVDMQLRIVGRGGGTDTNKAATTILVPANTDGIYFQHSNISAGGTDGSWSILEGVQVKAAASSTSGVGIKQYSHGTAIRNCSITGFKSHGIAIDSSGAGSPNCNEWRIDTVRITSCGGSGLFVDGADSNAGVATLIDASSNGAWGIYDSSFLGNTYVQCHTATNTSGAYKTDDNNSANVFLGCYSESDQGASSLVYPTLVIGGQHAAGFTAGTTAPVLTAALGNARWTTGVESVMASGGVTTTARVGGDASNADVVYTTKSDVESGLILRAKWSGSALTWIWNNTTRLLDFSVKGSNPMVIMRRAIALFRKDSTYGATVTIDSTTGNVFVIAVTDANAFTIANPTNVDTSTTDGQVITITVKNGSGGAMGVITWGGNFKMAAWTNPANANSRSIDFYWDNGGNVWRECGRTTVDVPN